MRMESNGAAAKLLQSSKKLAGWRWCGQQKLEQRGQDMESAPSSTTTVDGDGDTPTPAAGAAPFSLKGGGFDSRPGPAFHEEGPLFRDTTS